MSTKALVYIGMTVGSLIGGYLPVLWGNTSILSFTSVLTSGIGAVLGVWIGYTIGTRWNG